MTHLDNLPEGELMRYLEGRADEWTQQQVEKSAELSQLANDIGIHTRLLQTILHRQNCPSTSELGDFHLDLVTADRSQAITTHLARCPHCVREIAFFQNQLGKSLVTDPTTSWVKVLLAKLVPKSQPHQPRLAVRGGQSSIQRFLVTDEISVLLQIQDDPQAVGQKTLRGIILKAPVDMIVHVWQQKNLITTVAVNELGHFTVHALQVGQYEIVAHAKSIVIHIPIFEV